MIGKKYSLLRSYVSLIILFLIGGIIFSRSEYFECNQFVLIVNGVAALFEGLFGFGGSLIFLSLTVNKLGWTGSVILDCILASINLSYVVFLYRNELTRGIISRCLSQYAIAIVGLGIGLFYFIICESSTVRVVPFIIFGLIACSYKALILLSRKFKRVVDQDKTGRWKLPFVIIAGIGIGISNQEAPSSDQIFRGKAGAIAFFIILILITKIVLFSSVKGISAFSGISLINVIGYALSGFAFTNVGFRLSEKVERITGERKVMVERSLEYIKLIIVLMAILYLLFQAMK